MAQRNRQSQMLRQQTRTASSVKFGGAVVKAPAGVVDAVMAWRGDGDGDGARKK